MGLGSRVVDRLMGPGFLEAPFRNAAYTEIGSLLTDETARRMFEILGSGPTSSGMNVLQNPTVLRVSAVMSCVELIAGTISSLPLILFRRRPDGSREEAEDLPLHDCLKRLWNEETIAVTGRETQGAHLLLRGNAYVRIRRDGGGQVRELWTLKPECIRPFRKSSMAPIEFEYSEPGVPREDLQATDVWRIPGLSWNGVTGLSPIGLCREAVGLAMALEENTARAMKNGARVSGVLMSPGEATPKERSNVSNSFNEAYGSVENAGKIALLEGGWKFARVGMTFEDMQFLELKRFQVSEIARLFRVPLHLLYDDKAQPRANMEQSGLEFVVYTLRQWLVRIEQSIWRDLISPMERGALWAEHDVMGLLRGDIATRFAAYAQGRQWGWLSVNDILALENMELVGPAGDVRLQPMNMVPLGTPAEGSSAPLTEAEAELVQPAVAQLRTLRGLYGQDRLTAIWNLALKEAA